MKTAKIVSITCIGCTPGHARLHLDNGGSITVDDEWCDLNAPEEGGTIRFQAYGYEAPEEVVTPYDESQDSELLKSIKTLTTHNGFKRRLDEVMKPLTKFEKLATEPLYSEVMKRDEVASQAAAQSIQQFAKPANVRQTQADIDHMFEAARQGYQVTESCKMPHKVLPNGDLLCKVRPEFEGSFAAAYTQSLIAASKASGAFQQKFPTSTAAQQAYHDALAYGTGIMRITPTSQPNIGDFDIPGGLDFSSDSWVDWGKVPEAAPAIQIETKKPETEAERIARVTKAMCGK